MTRGSWILAVCVAAAAMPGCRCVDVTPDTVRSSSAPEAEREEALRRWEEAVGIANEFLSSPYRRTLPEGRFEGPGGRRFVTPGGAWPVEIRCTGWGDLVVGTGFAAQEATFGFVVGVREPEGRDAEPAFDNSFILGPDLKLHDAIRMAELLLHETTHDVYRVGAVGFWPSVVYYLECVVLFRSSTNSAENRPRATSEEFGYFLMAREAREKRDEAMEKLVVGSFEDHVSDPERHCEHGPFAETLEPPLPADSR